MPSVLIVEDNVAHLRGLVDQFSDKGFIVSSAADGEEGLRLALSETPDIIILDIMLPGKNGYEVCEAIRKQGLLMPIVMLTAKDQEQDVIYGLELGADDYVTKPFRGNELFARVKALLRRTQAAKDDQLSFGEFVMDLNSHQLRKNGEEIALTNKEFDLLQYFLSKPNCALTRAQIMKAVWGNRIIVTPRSVDRCVTTLRSKIETTPAEPDMIHTLRNIGYRFQLPE